MLQRMHTYMSYAICFKSTKGFLRDDDGLLGKYKALQHKTSTPPTLLLCAQN